MKTGLVAEVTNRPKDCIICGGPTGSREHVFPSALGGRREDKKIYCSAHNQWMGPHVAILQAQLEAINAMLEVKPDRGKVRSHVFADGDGERYVIRGSEVLPVADLDAILNSYTPGEAQDLKLAPEDLPRLKERAKQRGFTLHVTEQTSPTAEYRVGPYKISMMQGGDDAMRAVSYLALTFVAHRWPHVARSPGLAAVKDMLRSGSVYVGEDSIASPQPASEFVDWSPVLDASAELRHPTGLGHTVVLCVLKGQVLAYVSLLDLQCWTIRLGDAATSLADRTDVIHIDPLKTGYGDDWRVQEFDHALLDGLVDPNYLRKTVLESHRMQRQVAAVMGRVMDRRDRLEAEAATQEFAAVQGLPSPAREAAIHDFVAKRRQRLVNHISMFAEHLTADTPTLARVKAGALKATQSDPDSSDGLNPAARRVLDLVVTIMSRLLAGEAVGFVLTRDYYIGLFGYMGQQLIAIALEWEEGR